jgi:hypothetical protein
LIRLSAIEMWRVFDARGGWSAAGSAASVTSASLVMQRQLTAFVEHPDKATYLAARDAVLRLSPLPIVATDLADLERLLECDAAQDVLDRIDTLPPSKVLSPRVHFLAAEAAEILGDSAAVELERSLFVLTLQGLLATGDGSRGNPFVVCHPTDEYDIVEVLGREAASQSLVEYEGRLHDLLVCSDGRQIWFDITDLLVRRQPRKRPASRRRSPTRRAREVSRVRP